MRLAADQDAFGHALSDAHNGKDAWEIVERDDGYIDAVDARNYLAPFRQWPSSEKRAIRLARGRILDIGCGGGRVALYLQERGRQVVGIDVSPLAVRVCRERGLRDARVLPVTAIDARLGAFDTIVMLGNNFGLFGNPRRLRWLLQRFRKASGPGARILASSIDLYRTTDPLHLAYQRSNVDRGRMAGELRLRVRYKTYATPWFPYFFASPTEVEELVEDTGWRVDRFVETGDPVYVSVIERE